MRGLAVLRPLALAVLAGALGLALGMTAAQAYFRASGAGFGAAGTGSSGTVDLSPGTLTRGLYPGGQATVTTVAGNATALPVVITGLALDTGRGTGGFAVDAAHAGCPLTEFSFPTQRNGILGWTVPANGSLAISLPSSVTASAATANACQGAALTVYLVAVP